MAITFFSLLILGIQVDAQTRTTATSTREDTSGAASTVTRAVKDKGFEAGAIARSIVEEASQLKNDAAEWGQKLQELEADLKNNQNVDDTVKDLERWLVVPASLDARNNPIEADDATIGGCGCGDVDARIPGLVAR
jgi:hypothetical protein